MQLTRKCAGCKQDIHKNEMIQYSSLSGKTTLWYCKSCYEEKLARERFSNKVCEIFGIKSPGPVIWAQRKKIREKYAYTDDTIVDCLDYVYNVKHIKKLSESLYFVKPDMIEEMKKWKKNRAAQGSGMAAAILNTQVTEAKVKVRENNEKRKEINLDDALLE